MGRTPVLTTFRTGDEVVDRNLDHFKQTLNPVLRNPLFNAADFRWLEVAATSATGTPTFALQYRTQETWATILTLTSAGQIVQPAWIAPTLINGFANFGAPFLVAGYMKDAQGFVHLRGLLANAGAEADGVVAFVLPAGYRPSSTVRASAAFGSYVDVDSSGNVAIRPASGGGSNRALDGITFDTRS